MMAKVKETKEGDLHMITNEQKEKIKNIKEKYKKSIKEKELNKPCKVTIADSINGIGFKKEAIHRIRQLTEIVCKLNDIIEVLIND